MVCALQGSKVRGQVLCDGSHLVVTAVGGGVLLDHAPPLPHSPREERTLLHRLTVFLTQRSTGLRGGGRGRGDTALTSHQMSRERERESERDKSCQFSRQNEDIYGFMHFADMVLVYQLTHISMGAWNNTTESLKCTKQLRILYNLL